MMTTTDLFPQPGRWLPGAALLRTTEFNAIPAMTDPLGRHWDQPADMRLAPMDAVYVQLTARQVDGLCEYSSSFPSGTYSGKCWLRKQGAARWLCWYEPGDLPVEIGIGSREILVSDGGGQ